MQRNLIDIDNFNHILQTSNGFSGNHKIEKVPLGRRSAMSEKKAQQSKIEKVPRGIRGEKSSKDMASSRNLVSKIEALASPKMGDGTRCPEG